ncbi:MAG: hypothetical protein ACO28S_01650 [Bacteroidia bacterium]
MPASSFQRILFIIALAMMAGCRSEWMGDLRPNLSPETYAVVDSIQRSGPDRLPTTVQLHWWGLDPDGTIAKFEMRVGPQPLGNLPWTTTLANDTLVRLNLPPGPDSSDFVLEIRATDNQDATDTTPARLILPLRNTAPVLSFVYNPDGGSALAGAFPVLTFPVLGYRWKGTDADGDSTLLYYEICLNDTLNGDTVRIPARYNECILDWAPNSGLCQVLAGPSDWPITKRLAGLILGDTNRLYVRAIDQSLAPSSWVASRPSMVRPAVATVLLVNAYGNDPNPDLNADTLSNRYLGWLNSLGVSSIAELRLFQKSGNRYTQLSVNERVQARVFARFGRILWIAPDFELALQFSSKTLGPFFQDGGHLLLAAKADAGTPAWSTAYESSPIDSVTEIPAGSSFLLTDTSSLQPLSTQWNGQSWTLPALTHQGFSSGNRPLKPGPSSTSLYRINLLLRNDNNPAPPFPLYTGPSTCMVVRQNSLNGSTYTLSSIELHRMLPAASRLNLLQSLLTRVWQLP